MFLEVIEDVEEIDKIGGIRVLPYNLIRCNTVYPDLIFVFPLLLALSNDTS